MKKISYFIFGFLFNSCLLFSQVSVKFDGSLPDSSAMLDVQDTARGILIPRMPMAKFGSILHPAQGLLIYCTDDNNFFVNRGTPLSPDWTMVNSKWRSNGPHIYFTGQNVGIGCWNPGAKLDIRGNHPDDPTALSIGDSNLVHKLMLSGGRMSDPNPFIQWKVTDDLRFMTDAGGGSEKMRITNNGKVGIGTISPESLFEVFYSTYNYCSLGYTDGWGNYIFHFEDPSYGAGQTGLRIRRDRSVYNPNDGTGYDENTSNTAMAGVSIWGDLYSFGTAGFNDNDNNRCGGILGGTYYEDYWGSLGYKESGGTGYGGYFTSSTTGTGKSNQNASTGIGMGAWGDLMGADIHGKIYGIFAEGENYAMFSHGPTYRDNIDVHLQNNGTATNTALYTFVATEVSVQTCGTATLFNGTANISFDPAFSASVSSEAPVVVTVTPMGESNGVYLADVTCSGITVVENNNGRSNVTVNYIAVGRRAGYENPDLSHEVIDASYASKIARGLHNDADKQTNGEGLYYENGALVVGVHPSTLPDPNKASRVTSIPKPTKHLERLMNDEGKGLIGD